MSWSSPISTNPQAIPPAGRHAALLGLLCLVSSMALGQSTGSTVRGIVRDSASGQPLPGAVVQLRSQSSRRSTRSDDMGSFRLNGIPDGRYRLSVRRVGYLEHEKELRTAFRDTFVLVDLHPVARKLPTVRVRENVTAIYGMIAASHNLRPIPGAVVQVVGARRYVASDIAGRFIVGIEKPGTYVLRISREGYVQEVFSMQVPRGRAVEASRLLDSSSKRAAPGLNVLWEDFDQRLRWRGMNSALIPGSELRRYGGLLASALGGTPTFTSKGLRIGARTCVFVNGVPRPGWPLDAFPIEDIEAVEVYGRNCDPTSTLAQKWPPGVPCTETTGGAGLESNSRK